MTSNREINTAYSGENETVHVFDQPPKHVEPPDHDIDFPDFINNFCIPEDLYEREYDSDTIKKIIEQVGFSSQLIEQEHKKNIYPFFVVTIYLYSPAYIIKFFDLGVGFYGPHSAPHVTFDEKTVLTIKYKKETDGEFVIDNCEMTDIVLSKVALFMMEYLNETANNIRQMRREITLSKLEEMKCPMQ